MKRIFAVLLLLAGALSADEKPIGFWLAGGGGVYGGGSRESFGYGGGGQLGVYLPPLETRMNFILGFDYHSATLSDSLWGTRNVTFKALTFGLGAGTAPKKSTYYIRLSLGMNYLMMDGTKTDMNEPSSVLVPFAGLSAGKIWGQGLFLELAGSYTFESTYGYFFGGARAGIIFAPE